MKNYIFSDLACENVGEKRVKSKQISNRIQKITFCGDARTDSISCMTFYTPKLWCLSNEEFFILSRAIAEELREAVYKAIKPQNAARILVVGLGNPRISSDSLGARVIDGVYIKRPMSENASCIMAVAPDVSGNTGIETLDTLKVYVASSKADAVVAVDALRARSYQRLAATVQLSNGGIKPGSGVGGYSAELSYETLGVPIVSIGIPTVISSATLLYDVLSRFGDLEVDVTELLENNANFLVTPKEIDLLIRSGGMLLSDAINAALS